VGLAKFIAGQLRKPSGLVGKILTSRLLNLGNADSEREHGGAECQ
jgi:hypothetical protein